MSGLSDDDAVEGKREVDETIAQELRHQEDSYTEQIASLDIDNTKVSTHQMQAEESAPSAIERQTDEDPMMVNAMDIAEDSDEEFRLMDEQIAAQVLVEKRKSQAQNGAKIKKLCAQVGRCPICTLQPPCNHRTNATK